MRKDTCAPTVHVCCAVLCVVAQLVQLFVTPRTVLEWIAMRSSRRSSQPKGQTQVSHTAGGFFTIQATREAPMAALFTITKTWKQTKCPSVENG